MYQVASKAVYKMKIYRRRIAIQAKEKCILWYTQV